MKKIFAIGMSVVMMCASIVGVGAESEWDSEVIGHAEIEYSDRVEINSEISEGTESDADYLDEEDFDVYEEYNSDIYEQTEDIDDGNRDGSASSDMEYGSDFEEDYFISDTLMADEEKPDIDTDSGIAAQIGAVFYENSLGRQISELLATVLCQHLNTECMDAIAPTGSSTGLTEGLRCVDCGEILTTQMTLPMITTSAPVLTGIKLTEKGVYISWKACDKAELYRVFRKKSGDTKWTRVGITNRTAFYDMPPASGVTYVYTVRCLSNDETTYMSAYDKKGLSISYVACPKITSITNGTNKVVIKWGKIKGAAKYRVFIKKSDGTWSAIGTTTETQLSYTKLAAGATGTFTVRCLNTKGQYNSAYEKQGVQAVRLLPGTIASTQNKDKAVDITWNAVKGAKEYRIYRKLDGDASYTLLKRCDPSEPLQYRDNGPLVNGKKYYYAVRALSGSSASTYTPRTHIYIAAPEIETAANNADNTITAIWTQNKYASGYEIHVSDSKNPIRKKFSQYSTVKGYVSGLKKGTTYKVYIRCYRTISGKTYYSGWSAPVSVAVTKGNSVNMTTLRTRLQSIINGRGGSWSVYVKELKSGEVLSINECSMYPASVIKLFVMASTFDQIYRGNLKRTSYINSNLTEMITVSDNEAFNELVRFHSGSHNFVNGAQVVNKYLKAYGYDHTECHSTLHPSSSAVATDGHRNCASAKDAGIMLERIINGECVSPEYSAEMLNLLKRQTRTWKIPAGVPSGVTVANKTGETDNYQHDVAIVYGPKCAYIICVFSNTNEYNGCEGIRQISSTVYNYLN